MSWASIPTFSDGNALTGAQMEIIAANIEESAPSKATTAGYHFVSTGTNAIAERPITSAEVLTQETTTNTSYTDLTTTGPTVTQTTGTHALIHFSCQMFNSGSSSSNWSCYSIFGATTIASNDQHAISCEAASATQAFKFGATFLETLTAGSNSFRQKYRVGSNTGTFDDRHVAVMAL